MGIRWTTKPTEINLAGRMQAMRERIGRVARTSALAMEQAAKLNAPWTDDTGTARNGLRGFVQQSPNRVRIVLCHSVEYGVFLELARGGKYAILWPTIEQELPNLKAALEGQ